VFDSTIILEYIEDRWPQPSLLPSAPAERARVRMLEELCDTYFEAINWAIAEIRAFGRAEGEPAARLLARAEEQIGGMYGYLERQLGSRPFFNGEHFGWGDLSVYPYVAGSVGHGFSPPPASGLASWLEQVGKRESIRTCSAAAQEAMAGFQNLKPLVEQRLLIREYRDHRLEWMMRSGGAQIVADGMANGNIRFSVEIE
jgi:glutathione S-transferase